MFLCGLDVAPRFAPDGNRILFTCAKAGTPWLWIANREGQDFSAICEGDQGTWAPGGSRIFFRRRGQILQRDLASGEEKTVSPPGWESCAFRPGSLESAVAALRGQRAERVRGGLACRPGLAGRGGCKDPDVYAILPRLPEGTVLLKTVVAQPSTRVSLLGTDKIFTWQTVDGGIAVTVPPLLAKEVPCQHAWVLKLTNVQ